MSWKDHLTPAERHELLEIEAEKAKIASAYNSTWRKLKARCDARQRRITANIKDKQCDASSSKS